MVGKKALQIICYKKEAMDSIGLRICTLQISSFNPFILWMPRS